MCACCRSLSSLEPKGRKGDCKIVDTGLGQTFSTFPTTRLHCARSFFVNCIGLRGSSGSPLEMEITGFLFRLFDLTFRDRSLTTAALSVCLSISSLDYVS